MDGYQLIAAIFQSVVSLAWPATVLGCVWLFRSKLNDLLPFLRMKYKDFDISFRLQEAEKEAALLPPPSDLEQSEPTPEEKDKFEKIAEISPRAAILEVRTDIEEAVRSAARAAKMLSPKVQSTLGLTRLLRSNEVIDAQTSALLDDLRVIGNNAAHRADAQFSTDEALRYRSLANQAISRLRTSEL